HDIKKVLAYSTVSQLGFMFPACGVGAPVIGTCHVRRHACFTALMFLGAGSANHGTHHEQARRHMGNPRKDMPYAYCSCMAGGFVGISTAFTGGKEVGGRINIVTWLNPIIWNPKTSKFGMESSAEATAETSKGVGISDTFSGAPWRKEPDGFNLAHAAQSKL